MRIILCLDSLQAGGTELNAVRTAEQLREHGLDVLLLVWRAEGPLMERCRTSGLDVIAYPIAGLGSPRTLLRGAGLARLLRSLAPDVVHTQDRYSNAFAVPWSRLARIPVLASRRWWDVHPSRALGLANRAAYHLASGVVANSDRVADLVARSEGVPRDRITVIPNFLDPWALQEPSGHERSRLRKELGIPREATVVGSVANLRAVKGHSILLDAVAPLFEGRPDLILALVGDGECRPELQRQAERLGIADRIVFAGQRNDPVNWHIAFDVSVLASLHEGFPNTLVEAMAAARPIVATDVGGCADAVADGRTGFLVPARDVTAMSNAVRRLLQDPRLAVEMGRAGRVEALRRHRAEVVIPALKALYLRTGHTG